MYGNFLKSGPSEEANLQTNMVTSISQAVQF